MTFKRNISLVLAVAAMAFAGVASADVPGMLTQQGRLLDSAGAPVPDGQISFTFTIYDAMTDGSSLWTETQDITTEDGFFSAQLGEMTAFPANFFDGATMMYLGVQVGSDDEMTPRQPLNSVPFAMKAGMADTATNVTGAITPTSISTGNGTFSGSLSVGGPVTVAGTQVINASGTWVGAIDFTNIVDIRPVTTGTTTTQANACATGDRIVSGGCVVPDAADWIRMSYPVVSKNGVNSWSCGCGGTSCTVTAYAICLQ